MSSTDVPDPQVLEEERDFLLKSLDDLEAERESGAIDDESYAELRDDYTARAAAVIRTLRDGVDSRPAPAASASPRRRLAIIAGIVVVAIVAGVGLAGALGARLPGETASGNTRSEDEATAARLGRTIKTLQAKVNANPDDYDARLALAHAYEAVGDYRNALEQSDAAITIDATRPEAHANAGRLLYLAVREHQGRGDARSVHRRSERRVHRGRRTRSRVLACVFLPRHPRAVRDEAVHPRASRPTAVHHQGTERSVRGQGT